MNWSTVDEQAVYPHDREIADPDDRHRFSLAYDPLTGGWHLTWRYIPDSDTVFSGHLRSTWFQSAAAAKVAAEAWYETGY